MTSLATDKLIEQLITCPYIIFVLSAIIVHLQSLQRSLNGLPHRPSTSIIITVYTTQYSVSDNTTESSDIPIVHACMTPLAMHINFLTMHIIYHRVYGLDCMDHYGIIELSI